MSNWNDPLSPYYQPPLTTPTATSSEPSGFPEVPGMPGSWTPTDPLYQPPRRPKRGPVITAAVIAIGGFITLVAIGVSGGGSDDEGAATSRAPSLTTTVVTSTSAVKTPSSATPSTSPAPTAPTTVPPSADAVPVLSLLPLIVIANEVEPGYDRDRFRYPGPRDGAGCDTADLVLIAESSSVAQVAYPGCEVVAGDWLSLYDLVEFTDPAELEVDHVVALKEAWNSGAWAWSEESLAAYANDTVDPRTLRAVSVSTNRSKGDRDPSNWMPPAESVWCQYLADWVAIKLRWSLTMDQSEFGRIQRLLRNDCRDTRVEPIDPEVITYIPLPDPDPDPDPDRPYVVPVPIPGGGDDDGGGSVSVYYANCDAARRAGAAPLYAGELGYRSALDRDRDGVACE